MNTSGFKLGWITRSFLAAAALALWVPAAPAQTQSGLGGGSGLSGGMGGSGFSGGSSGSSLLGSSGSGSSFTGSSGTGTLGTTGTGTRGTRGTSGTGQVVPQTSDPFRTYYATPMSYGVASTSGTITMGTPTVSFGQPLYGTLGSPTTTTGLGGVGSLGTMGTAGGFSTVGMRRGQGFITVPGYGTGPVGPAAAAPAGPGVPSPLQVELQTMLTQSPSFSANDAIRVAVQADTVILSGRVANDREARLAENLVRLTPGVNNVRNDLKVAGAVRVP